VNLESLYIRGNNLTTDDIHALQTMLPKCLVIFDDPVVPTPDTSVTPEAQ